MPTDHIVYDISTASISFIYVKLYVIIGFSVGLFKTFKLATQAIELVSSSERCIHMAPLFVSTSRRTVGDDGSHKGDPVNVTAPPQIP